MLSKNRAYLRDYLVGDNLIWPVFLLPEVLQPVFRSCNWYAGFVQHVLEMSMCLDYGEFWEID